MEAKVDSHGTHQFEVTFVYPVPRDLTRTRYRCEMYLFTPSQLAVTKERYGPKRFLEDVRSYTRYTIPAVTLESLIDPACNFSPLVRLQRFLDDGPAKNTSGMVYEFRMLVCIFRARSKERRKELERELTLRSSSGGGGVTVGSVVEFRDHLLEVLKVFRTKILAHAELPHCEEIVRESARWADEALSLTARKQWLFLLAASRGTSDFESVRALLGEAVKNEDEYQARLPGAEHGCSREEAGLRAVQRESVLKKWAEGCLYMSAPKNKAADQAAQALLGIAAEVAMLFAVVATIQVNRWFRPESLQWALLIVVMYMLKDRIKEWLRTLVSAHLPQILADRTEDLVDFAGAHGAPKTYKVGSSRLRARVLKAGRVVREVRESRDRCDGHEPSGPEEDVIEFQKELNLDAALLLRRHQRLDSITEILRVEVDALLSKMDDATAVVRRYFDGEVEEFSVPRVYRAHLLLRFGEAGGRMHLVRYRIDLTRAGIFSIESVADKEAACDALSSAARPQSKS